MATKTPSKSRPASPTETRAINPDMTDDFRGQQQGRNIGDITNPFLSRSSGTGIFAMPAPVHATVPHHPFSSSTGTTKSAPSSPVKRSSSQGRENMTIQFGGERGRTNVVGEGGWEGDMISMGGGGGGGAGKGGFSGRNLDRFIPSRPSSSASNERPSLHHHASSLSFHGDNNSHSLSGADISFNASEIGNTSSNNNAQPHTRILSFHAAPPPSSSINPHASSHLELSQSYLPSNRSRPSSSSTSAAAAGNAPPTGGKRRIPAIPERVLDAPGYLDDYYLNLLSWSCTNKVGIALGNIPYVWDAEDGGVKGLGEDTLSEDEQYDPGRTICSLSWAPDGAYLAVGMYNGNVELWDADSSKRVRVMRGHQARVSSLSWTGHVLSSGCKDGSIHHHDVRIPKHLTHHLKAHTQEVCGLTWRNDGQLLASGANDNMVAVWDNRVMRESVLREAASTTDQAPVVGPRWTKTSHTAAVKALSWCPWQSSLLATGGGNGDNTIHFWNATTGARVSSLQTNSQITSLIWSPHSKEILATHGFPNHAISLWAYPSGQKVGELQQAHDMRILTSALSPDGCTVVTGAGDENLKFWKIWEPKTGYKSKQDERDEALLVKGKPAVGMWR